MTSHMAAM